MLKPRNIIITFLISFVILAVIVVFMEFQSLKRQSNSVNSLIPVAAELAIEQAQSIDDAFNSSQIGYGQTGELPLELLVDTANLTGGDTSKAFQKVELFPYYYNRTDKKSIYESMFINGKNGEDLREWAMQAKAVKRKFRVFDSSNSWVEIPKIVNMGTDTFQSAKFEIFPQTSDAVKVYEQYRLEDYQQKGGAFGTMDYFYTPRNLDMTYVNEDMVEFLFLNNLDIIFRGHFGEGGSGIAEGMGPVATGIVYKHLKKKELTKAGVINNGLVMVDRGRLSRNADDKLTYNNTITKSGKKNVEVTYKVIDAYDSRNDSILKELYGANLGTFSNKATQIQANDKEVDIEKLYTGTGVDEYVESRYIVVAEVKFKVGVYVPYSQPIIRSWMDQFGSKAGGTNRIDLNRSATNNIFEYVKYYAVI